MSVLTDTYNNDDGLVSTHFANLVELALPHQVDDATDEERSDVFDQAGAKHEDEAHDYGAALPFGVAKDKFE